MFDFSSYPADIREKVLQILAKAGAPSEGLNEIWHLLGEKPPVYKLVSHTRDGITLKATYEVGGSSFEAKGFGKTKSTARQASALKILKDMGIYKKLEEFRQQNKKARYRKSSGDGFAD